MEKVGQSAFVFVSSFDNRHDPVRARAPLNWVGVCQRASSCTGRPHYWESARLIAAIMDLEPVGSAVTSRFFGMVSRLHGIRILCRGDGLEMIAINWAIFCSTGTICFCTGRSGPERGCRVPALDCFRQARDIHRVTQASCRACCRLASPVGERTQPSQRRCTSRRARQYLCWGSFGGRLGTPRHYWAGLGGYRKVEAASFRGGSGGLRQCGQIDPLLLGIFGSGPANRQRAAVLNVRSRGRGPSSSEDRCNWDTESSRALGARALGAHWVTTSALGEQKSDLSLIVSLTIRSYVLH